MNNEEQQFLNEVESSRDAGAFAPRLVAQLKACDRLTATIRKNLVGLGHAL